MDCPILFPWTFIDPAWRNHVVELIVSGVASGACAKHQRSDNCVTENFGKRHQRQWVRADSRPGAHGLDVDSGSIHWSSCSGSRGGNLHDPILQSQSNLLDMGPTSWGQLTAFQGTKLSFLWGFQWRPEKKLGNISSAGWENCPVGGETQREGSRATGPPVSSRDGRGRENTSETQPGVCDEGCAETHWRTHLYSGQTTRRKVSFLNLIGRRKQVCDVLSSKTVENDAVLALSFLRDEILRKASGEDHLKYLFSLVSLLASCARVSCFVSSWPMWLVFQEQPKQVSRKSAICWVVSYLLLTQNNDVSMEKAVPLKDISCFCWFWSMHERCWFRLPKCFAVKDVVPN